MSSIIDKGFQLSVDDNELNYLIRMGYVYKDRDGYYHPTDAIDHLFDINDILNNERMMA